MSRRKNYTNHHHQEVNFLVEDRAYLQTTPLEGTNHFHVKRKITPRFTVTPSRSRQDEEKTVRSWSYHLSYQLCTTFSTWHNTGSVSNFLTIPITNKDINHHAIDPQPNLTYAKNPLTTWIKKNVIHEATIKNFKVQ